MKSEALLAAMGLAVGTALLPSAASANNISHASGFICGDGPGSTNNRFVNGEYRAAFNIRNSSRRTQSVELMLTVTFPPGDPFEINHAVPVPDSGQPIELDPGEALMIDCDELATAANQTIGGSPPYFAGTLEILSQQALDVTLLHSAGNQGSVSSLAVNEVSAKRVGRRVDR